MLLSLFAKHASHQLVDPNECVGMVVIGGSRTMDLFRYTVPLPTSPCASKVLIRKRIQGKFPGRMTDCKQGD